MLFSTVGQWRVFAAMMVAGALVAAVYDLFALARRLLRAGALLSLAADLLFGACAAALLGGMLTLANHGQLRLFALLGAAAGAGLYALGPHRAGRALCVHLSRAVRRIVRRIAKFRLIKVIFR